MKTKRIDEFKFLLIFVGPSHGKVVACSIFAEPSTGYFASHGHQFQIDMVDFNLCTHLIYAHMDSAPGVPSSKTIHFFQLNISEFILKNELEKNQRNRSNQLSIIFKLQKIVM